MSDWSEHTLNQRRDAYVAGMRSALQRFNTMHPSEELELKGILGRADSVLEAQAPALERLVQLDLEAKTVDPEELEDVLNALVRAQHLPRMITCFSRILLQEEKSDALAPIEAEVALLARDLALLTEEWILRRQDLLGPDELLL